MVIGVVDAAAVAVKISVVDVVTGHVAAGVMVDGVIETFVAVDEVLADVAFY